MLTSKELNRLNELKNKALLLFLDTEPFYTEDWLNDKDREEYFKLEEKQ
jgi:hypothetical protein